MLRTLSPDDLARLKPFLRDVVLAKGAEIYKPGDRLQNVYFPCGATLITFSIPIGEERNVDTLFVGREGVVGGFGSWGQQPSFYRIYTPTGGDVLTVAAGDLQTLEGISPVFGNLFARYSDCLVAQIFQAAACNSAHSIEQRVSRLLCDLLNRSGSAEIMIKQEQLASWLGVGRPYITKILRDFRRAGILTVRRGSMRINEPSELRRRSCECNELVTAHFAQVLGALYDTRLS